MGGTQSGGALRNGVEYRLYVGGRTCDHPQDLARRRLLLQRLGQVLIASLELLEQPHVLDGDDGLVGEGLEQRDLLVGERPYLISVDCDDTEQRSRSDHRDRHDTSDGVDQVLHPKCVLGLAQRIFDVDGLTLEGGTPRRATPSGHDGIFFEIRFELRAGVVLRCGMQTLTVEPPDSTVLRAAEPHRVFDQRLEDWLEIEGRAADDLEDLARRRLLLQRLTNLRVGLGQRPILLLQFREQPHVLDGDDCLVGEGLQQLDLAIRERPGLGARYLNDADGSTLPQHGDEEAASPADRAAKGLMLVLWIEVDIGYVDNRTLEDRPAGKEGPGWARRKYAMRRLESLGSVVVLGDQMEQLAIEPIERAEESATQPHRAADDRVEDRLGIGRRG